MAVTLLELSLRGHHFDVDLESLARDSRTLLSAVARGVETLPKDGNGRLYINRSPELFNHILDYYETGKLRFPAQHTWDVVKAELDFWRLDSKLVTNECDVRYDAERLLARRAKEIASGWERYDYMSRGTLCPDWARRWRSVWEFVDIPQSSRPAMVTIYFHYQYENFFVVEIYPKIT
jgi:hypothetical protein